MSDERSADPSFERFTVEELVTIVHHEAYTEREKRLAKQCLYLLDKLMLEVLDKKMGESK